MAEPDVLDIAWYVMLFATEAESARLAPALRGLAAATDGEADRDLHVTIGYFHGPAAPAEVVDRLQPLDGPPVAIHAHDVVVFSDKAQPGFGWALLLRASSSPALRRWRRAVHDALRATSLTPVRPVEEDRLHVRVVHRMGVPPSEARRRLADRPTPISFIASRLVVSRRIGDDYLICLDKPLTGHLDA